MASDRFCECSSISGVFRDGRSTCKQCGGRDAYKKSNDNPFVMAQRIKELEEEVKSLKLEAAAHGY